MIGNKLRGGQGVIRGAMFRPDVGGSISLYWGRPGSPKKKFNDGSGISKILASRRLRSGNERGAEIKMNYSIVGANDWWRGGVVQFQLTAEVPEKWFENLRVGIKQ